MKARDHGVITPMWLELRRRVEIEKRIQEGLRQLHDAEPTPSRLQEIVTK